MASTWPNYPGDTAGGDEPTFSPNKSQNSLLAAERGSQRTKRLETDASGNLFVTAPSLPLPTGAATEATLVVIKTDIDKNYGTWAYYSGISGTVVVSGGQRVVGISAYSALGGSLTINGGSTITLPVGVAVSIEPNGNLVAPTIVFTGTSTYFIEVVS